MPHGDRPGQTPRSLSPASRLPRPASRGIPTPGYWLFHVVGEGQRPILNYSGGTEISGVIIAGNVLTPLKPAAFAGPVPGIDADVVDDDGQPAARGCGRTVDPPALDGHDPRLLARSRPLPRNVLEPLPRCVGAWRFRRHRRGRAMVHSRSLGRHDQGGGQAPGPRGGREHSGRAPGGARSRGRGRAPPCQRLGPGLLRGAASRAQPHLPTCRRTQGTGGARKWAKPSSPRP